MVQRLSEQALELGLVATAPNPAHRRSRLITPTDTGRAAFERLHAVELRNLGEIAADLTPDDVIKALDLGPVLVGLSMGAAAAVDTVLEHPHLIRAVVACSAGASAHTGLGQGDFRDPWLLEPFADLDAAARAWDAAAWTEIYLAAGLAGPYRTLADLDPDVVARCRQMITDTLVTHIAPGPAPHRRRCPTPPSASARSTFRCSGSPARSTHPTTSAWCTSSSTALRGRP